MLWDFSKTFLAVKRIPEYFCLNQESITWATHSIHNPRVINCIPALSPPSLTHTHTHTHTHTPHTTNYEHSINPNFIQNSLYPRNGLFVLFGDFLNLSESHSVVSDSLWPYGLYSPWNSPGQNTGVGSCSLLQRIFLTQGLNLGLPHCRRILYQMSHQGSKPNLSLNFEHNLSINWDEQ